MLALAPFFYLVNNGNFIRSIVPTFYLFRQKRDPIWKRNW